MDDSYLVIARRYRPQTFADMIGQDPIVRTLVNALQSGRISHAYLFSGSRGTGKTSAARLYAKALNCTARLPSGEPCNSCSSCTEITESRSLDVLEIDGASHRGIDHIRSLTESASYAPSGGRYKIYIIDEVHMLTKEAFNALLKILEEPPQSVIFFLATTEPHKIPPTIVSRCQRFNFRRLSKEAIVSKLQRIVREMNVRADDEALLRIAGYADGGFRDAESLLDQVITFADGHIREAMVEEVLGIAPTEWLQELDAAIATANHATAYAISDRVFFEGKDIGHFIDDLCGHYRTQLLLQLNGSAPDKDALSKEQLLDLLNILAEAQRSLKTASSQRFLLEWLLLNIVRIQRRVSLPVIAKKLLELLPRSQGAIAAPVDTPSVQARAGKEDSPQPPPQKKPLPPPAPEPQVPNAVAELQAALPATSSRLSRRAPSPSAPKTTPPLPALPEEQEAARRENLIQFTAVELGATIVKQSSFKGES